VGSFLRGQLGGEGRKRRGQVNSNRRDTGKKRRGKDRTREYGSKGEEGWEGEDIKGREKAREIKRVWKVNRHREKKGDETFGPKSEPRNGTSS